MESARSAGRRSPYEVLFGAAELSDSRFAAIGDEAANAGVTTARRDQFASLNRVRELLGDLIPELAEPSTLDRYLLILHHCYSFWEAGCRHFSFERSAVRSVISAAPDLSDWRPRAPHSSLYLALPQNMFWAAVVEGEPPEPADGMFVNLRGGTAAGEAEVLLVLGVRPDRPGFSVAELSADLTVARGVSKPDAFASNLPGAELAGLYSLQQPAEVVMLLLRLLWYVDTYPEAVELEEGSPAADHDVGGCASTTTIDRYRVRVVKRSKG